MAHIPYLTGEGSARKLIVDGKPFRALGGELHNSNSSSLEYMENRIWPSLRPLGLNTVIAPIFWECIEPQQGVYDFTLIDGLIEGARREGVKLVFLWFALWKNGRSTYPPAWVKKDLGKYFRVQEPSGRPIEIISPLCDAAVEADAACFAQVMRHLAEVDEERTVITIQLENEIGVLGPDRDYSPVGNELFYSNVPPVIAEKYGEGTWEEVFGDRACEAFMVWAYAQAVDKVAAAGKAEYPLPMYVNAWLRQFPDMPGVYPVGGPVTGTMDWWYQVAPHVDFYGPDIYVEEFRDVVDAYVAEGNPLFIPEVRCSKDTPSMLLYAVGKHNAVCFSPYGIEDLFAAQAHTLDADQLNMLNISAAAFRQDPANGPRLAAAYRLISNMDEIINKAHEEGRIVGFLEYNDKGLIIQKEKYQIKVTFGRPMGMMATAVSKDKDAPICGGFIIEEDPDTFLVVGVGFQVDFYPKDGTGTQVQFIRKEEGTFVKGEWKPGRILNGDDLMFTRMDSAVTAQRIELYQYPNKL